MRLWGRDEDIARVVALVHDGARLVTLTGLGGIGKTTVARAVVATLKALRVAQVDAVGLRADDDLAAAIAEALAVELPVAARPFEALINALARRTSERVLLVLDNLEPLVDVVRAPLVRLVEVVPWLQVLATSRVPLGSAAEVVHAIGPLACDGPESDAVALLMARATHDARVLPAWRSDRAALMRLAARLDGLPLALELAAARAHLMAPAEIEALLAVRWPLCLPHRGPRQASLHAAIHWSYEQLAPREREVLTQLAVIEGTFDRDLIVQLLDVDTGTCITQLESLVRLSLLTVAPAGERARYRVLETVRQFVLARVDPAAREALDDRSSAALRLRIGPVSGHDALPPERMHWIVEHHASCLAVARRGLSQDRTRIEAALHVVTGLLIALRAKGLAAPLVPLACALLDQSEAFEIAPEVRVTAGIRCLMTLAMHEKDRAVLARHVARLEQWVDHGTPEMIVAVRLAAAMAFAYDWDCRSSLTRLDALACDPIVVQDLRMFRLTTELRVFARRELGLASYEEDDATLLQVQHALRNAGRDHEALLLDIGRVGFAHHMGHLDVAQALGARCTEAATALGFDAAIAYARTLWGRSLRELGRRREALAQLDLTLDAYQSSPILRGVAPPIETRLEHCATTLEMGLYDDTQARLDALAPALATSFECSYHEALSRALAALSGCAIEARHRITWTETVQDDALEVLLAIARPDPAVRQAANRSAPFSCRVRHALRLYDRAAGIGTTTMAVALDARAFRMREGWVDLSSRPMLVTLLDTLVEARMARDGGLVDKGFVAARLWPNERMATRSRDHRLYALLGTLRRLGCAVVGGDGMGIDPAIEVLRVAPHAWPGAEPVSRSRGRGRPRKDAGDDVTAAKPPR